LRQIEIENEILEQLKNSGEDILNDETLINSLNESKIVTQDIQIKLANCDAFEEKIEASRANYLGVSRTGAILFFAVQGLSTLDPMYQYSLEWFKRIYRQSFEVGELD